MTDPVTYTAPRRYGARVLVAEDNPVHRSLVRSLLEQMGCEVDAVGDGHEAIESYSSTHYDLILMDWRMPNLDGVSATQEIRRIEKTKASGQQGARIPIIALTAHALPGDRSRCLSAGMDDYLCKPVSRRNLDLILSKWATAIDAGASRQESMDEAATPGADADSVLDMSQIEELAAIERDGAPGLVAHLIDTYLTDAPAKLALLKTASAENDLLGVQVATHSFKSASSTVGAHRLYQMCNALERDARSGQIENLDSRVEGVLSEFSRVEEELAELKARFSAPAESGE